MRTHAAFALTAALAIGAVTVPMAGCASGSTAEGTDYDFRVNELIATVPYSIDQTYEAALEVMRDDMQWVVEESAVDAFDGRIVARGAADNVRRVRLERRGDRLTEVRVLVSDGPFGDEDRSRAVMSRIEERLAR
jgi:hypothetical protein